MPKLLSIDDEKEFCDFIRSYFSPRGYQVFTAHEGDSGIEIARKELPDIALIDLKMPGKHGDVVMSEVKQVSPATRIIMITASEGFGKTRERLLSIGAFACFDKPLTSLRDLEIKIKEAMSDGGR